MEAETSHAHHNSMEAHGISWHAISASSSYLESVQIASIRQHNITVCGVRHLWSLRPWSPSLPAPKIALQKRGLVVMILNATGGLIERSYLIAAMTPS